MMALAQQEYLEDEEITLTLEILSPEEEFYLAQEQVKYDEWYLGYSPASFRGELSTVAFKTIEAARTWALPRLRKFIRILHIEGKTHVLMRCSDYNQRGYPHLFTLAAFKVDHCGPHAFLRIRINEAVQSACKFILDDPEVIYSGYDIVPFNKWEPNPLLGNPQRVFNGFDGHTATPVEIVDMNLISPILKHIEEVWGNGNPMQYDWIMAWLCHLVVYPREKLPILTLIGERCVGKECLIVGFLFPYVFGEKNAYKCRDVDFVLRKFNNLNEGRSLIYIGDIAGYKPLSAIYRRRLIKLQQYKAQETVEIKYKRQSPRIMTNCANYISASDYDEALQLIDDDHQTFKVQSRGYDYYKELNSSFNQTVGDHFYTYLYLNRDAYPDPTVVLRHPIQ